MVARGSAQRVARKSKEDTKHMHQVDALGVVVPVQVVALLSLLRDPRSWLPYGRQRRRDGHAVAGSLAVEELKH